MKRVFGALNGLLVCTRNPCILKRYGDLGVPYWGPSSKGDPTSWGYLGSIFGVLSPHIEAGSRHLFALAEGSEAHAPEPEGSMALWASREVLRVAFGGLEKEARRAEAAGPSISLLKSSPRASFEPFSGLRLVPSACG